VVVVVADRAGSLPPGGAAGTDEGVPVSAPAAAGDSDAGGRGIAGGALAKLLGAEGADDGDAAAERNR
jgi:hypothetical protein